MNAPLHAATLAPDYLAEAIADEAMIARLLGWTNQEVPTVTTKNPFLWSTPPGYVPEWPGASGRTFLPKWRRSWEGAGQLIAQFAIDINQESVGGIARIPGYARSFRFAKHPSRDDALRAAICKAAIAHLTAERPAT